MISQEELAKLRGATVRVLSSAKSGDALSGKIRVVDHQIPIQGQSLNLEVEFIPGKVMTLQLNSSETRQLAKTPEGRDLEFRWNGKPRALRPVSVDDMVPVSRETYVSF